MTTILSGQQQLDVAPVRAGPGLWLGASDLARVTGFEAKPEGLCRDAICVPVPRGEKSFVDAAGAVDVAAFWRHMGHPVVGDQAGEVWVLGMGTGERTRALERSARLGAHNREVCGDWLGHAPAEIDAWTREGVI
jgi:hypothetical protein